MICNFGSNVEVVNYTAHHIHTKIKDSILFDFWMLTRFCGIPKTNGRCESWALLLIINQGPDFPWCIISDFNEIVKQDEIVGEKYRPKKHMSDFKDALENNNLFDIGWLGQKLTWSYRHKDESFTKERLDRALANQKWWEKFGFKGVEVLSSRRSEHQQILLSTREESSKWPKQKKIFRFEAKWTKMTEGELIIRRAWEKTNTSWSSQESFQRKLKIFGREVTKWSAKQRRDLAKEIGEKTCLLSREGLKIHLSPQILMLWPFLSL